MNKSNSYPKIIFLVSGKRKSGKDFICDKLLERVGAENLVIIRLSAPIKFHWAKMNNLRFSELLGSSEYKENYRKAMIEWGENMRNNDYGYFCKAGIEMVDGAANKPVWVISDARRRTDLKWFHDNYSNATIKTVRIYATEEIRALRGWAFEKGVDDVESECDLDSVDNWDVVFFNNNDDENFQKQFTVLTDMLKNALVE